MNICVCVKQVPDTAEIRIDPETNTLIRSGVPSIVNPFDLYALETAFRLREEKGGKIWIISMGPAQAEKAVRACLEMGADEGVLISGRAFGGSDTFSTGYILSAGIRAIEEAENIKFDLILCGRQAIDGDTAQVGPQVAEKLGLTQITYAEEILKVGDGSITVKRHIDGGVETVEGPLPIVITVNGSAAPCRPRNAKLVQKYKHAKTITEKQQGNLDYTDLYDTRDYLNLVEWSVADVNGDLKQCGLSGSPTKVKAIQNIVFQAKESKTISGSDREVEELIVELLENHTIG